MTSPHGTNFTSRAPHSNIIKKIHLGTWRIPGSNDVNQIDHILISNRHFSSVIDVRACRGPNCDSDHYLVEAIVREKLSTVQTLKRTRQFKWDSSKLRQDPNTLHTYQSTLDKKLENMQGTTLEEKWEQIKQARLETAQETVNQKVKERNKGWFNRECSDIIALKNGSRELMLARNTRSNAEAYEQLRRKSKQVFKKKNQIK